MIPLRKNNTVTSEEISQLIQTHYATLMEAFYELQSSFLCGIYKRYRSIETANIILCFTRNIHLEIIRQREKDLNFNVSLENFWKNLKNIHKPSEKITSVVKITGIPKETVRRKISNLMEVGFLEKDKKNKSYTWNLSEKDKVNFFKIIDNETKSLSTFISKIAKDLGRIQKKHKKFVEIGSYPFFRLGKIGVSIVLRSSKKSNLQSCHKDIIRIIKNKKIEIIRGV